jgi:methionyl-tRNA formyltransferase
MVAKLDAGDIMYAESTPIGATETAGELRTRLAEMAGQVLVKGLKLIATGKPKFTPQDNALATAAPSIEKPDGLIDWHKSAVEIQRFVRGMTPVPGSHTRLGARRYIVIEGVVETDGFGLGIPGGILSAGEEGIRVCTGDGIYRVLRIKPENGKNMTAGEFVRGHPMQPDARLG